MAHYKFPLCQFLFPPLLYTVPMKYQSLTFLSLAVAGAFVQASPIDAFDQFRIFRYGEPELRLVQYGWVVLLSLKSYD